MLTLLQVCRRRSTTLAKKKKTATSIMHKIRTLFLSWDVEKSSLIALRCNDARSCGKPRHCANLVIVRDKNSVLILCIIVVPVFFFLARVVVLAVGFFRRNVLHSNKEQKKVCHIFAQSFPCFHFLILLSIRLNRQVFLHCCFS